MSTTLLPYRNPTSKSARLPEIGRTARSWISSSRTALRMLMAAVGGLMVLVGVRRRSWTGGALAIAGGTCLVGAARRVVAGDETQVDGTPHHGFRFQTSMIVHRSPAELYEAWRELPNLPRVMSHLREVRPLDAGRSHWTAEGPLGLQIDWVAQIVADRPGELIAWQSLPGSEMTASGSVHFRPLSDDRGTAVEVSLTYDPPMGRHGARVAQWMGGGLERQVRRDLHAFKQRLEAYERVESRLALTS